MAEPDPSPNVPESWMTAGVGAGNSDEAAATPGKLLAKDTARLDMAQNPSFELQFDLGTAKALYLADLDYLFPGKRSYWQARS